MIRTAFRRAGLLAAAVALLVPAIASAASPVAANEPIVPALERISWAAIFAGAVVALAIHSALSTLGVGVGAAAIDPYNREHPTKGVPTTILVWMFVSGLVALFIGGWISGRLAGTVPFDSAIHGVIMWSFATVLILAFATTSMGAIVGGTFRLLGAGVSGVGSAIGGVASGTGRAVGGAASGAGQAVAAIVPEAADLAKDALGVPELDWKTIQREARKMLHIGGNGNNQGNENQNQGGQNNQNQNEQGNRPQQGQGKQGEQGQQGQQGQQNQQKGNQNDQQGRQGQGNDQQRQNGGQQGNGGQSGLQGAWDDTQDLIDMLTKAYGAIREGGLNNTDRDALMTAVSERAGINKDEANKTLEKWEKMYRDAKQQYDAALARAEQKARDAAATAASAVSKVAVWTFASLIFGVAVAAIGGQLGSTFVRL